MLIGNQNVGVLSFQGAVNGLAFSAAACHQNRTLFHFQVAELDSDRPAVNAAAANPAFLVKKARTNIADPVRFQQLFLFFRK